MYLLQRTNLGQRARGRDRTLQQERQNRHRRKRRHNGARQRRADCDAAAARLGAVMVWACSQRSTLSANRRRLAMPSSRRYRGRASRRNCRFDRHRRVHEDDLLYWSILLSNCHRHTHQHKPAKFREIANLAPSACCETNIVRLARGVVGPVRESAEHRNRIRPRTLGSRKPAKRGRMRSCT